MKVSELEGPLLDYWVIKAEHPTSEISFSEWTGKSILYSVAWQWGGPIIDRARIEVVPWNEPPHITEDWRARTFGSPVDGMHASREWKGSTALIAAMRAYVASKFGDEVEDAPQERAD